EIDVLAVHEDVLVETADAFEGAAAKEHRGATRPRRVEGHRIVGLRMLVRDLAQLPRRDLARFIAGRAHEPLEHARLEHAVLVEHEEEGRRSEGGVGVVPAAEADVRAGGRDDYARDRLVMARARPRTEGTDEIAVAAAVVGEAVAAQRL